MASIEELLEADFKKKYPHRNESTRKGKLKIEQADGSFTYKDYQVSNRFDFWYRWTDKYLEYETTHNYKVLDWLSNDTERIKALEEIKAEVINRLPPRYPKRDKILEFVEWKIGQIQSHIKALANSGATLPDGLNTLKARDLLNKIVGAGFLNEDYQLAEEYRTLTCWVALADFIQSKTQCEPTRLAKFWNKKNISSNLNKGRNCKKYEKVYSKIKSVVK